ncbi:hypothetical protein CLV63_1512 [Murinocardiopsis flavida]|uniref:Uncharacterized protein n=1 Tax=Murinocardiopsis flavida TaxID=645275 RepID=A0A2P8C7C8_9ACTN|nr:hypothetical protein [Murinocardiopsis flavida]PSK80856.1 hypothetical protein CLV63_1512 [Murinocardiopsis flavida]
MLVSLYGGPLDGHEVVITAHYTGTDGAVFDLAEVIPPQGGYALYAPDADGAWIFRGMAEF